MRNVRCYLYNQSKTWNTFFFYLMLYNVVKYQDNVLFSVTCPHGSTGTCGGIAGLQCPRGSSCRLDGSYPDAGGICCVDSPGRGKITNNAFFY